MSLLPRGGQRKRGERRVSGGHGLALEDLDRTLAGPGPGRCKRKPSPNEKRTPRESLTGHRWEKLQVCLIGTPTLLIVSDTARADPFPASQRLQRRSYTIFSSLFRCLPLFPPPVPRPCQHSP